MDPYFVQFCIPVNVSYCFELNDYSLPAALRSVFNYLPPPCSHTTRLFFQPGNEACQRSRPRSLHLTVVRFLLLPGTGEQIVLRCHSAKWCPAKLCPDDVLGFIRADFGSSLIFAAPLYHTSPDGHTAPSLLIQL